MDNYAGIIGIGIGVMIAVCAVGFVIYHQSLRLRIQCKTRSFQC